MNWLKELLERLGLADKFEDIRAAVEANYKGYVPKERFDEVNDQKKEYKKMLDERTTQLEELKGKAQGNEELLNKIKELEGANTKTAADYEKKIADQSFSFALESALKDGKVKNTKAVKALLDLEGIKLDGDKLTGLDEQISKLKESDSYLFEVENAGGTGGAGNFGRNNGKTGVTKEQFGKMSYNERVSLYNENPELYKQLND
ncbi:MAG: scaffolding protein [Peptoclostridium sp.]|uniref:phage scaffolding protein n=1 Tax=Peptoclostridium sp. TaxID=1904860 RepID=UPI00139CF02D|nr:phage scaffolding protein [Peptoclostridium sp.]MZQ75258.1 scaffolding protein [Peptoclostridium sp.]